MKNLFIIILIHICLANSTIIAQKTMKTFQSKFVPESVTYNGSPNPNECWESVTWGLKVQVGKSTLFFAMNYQQIENLKVIIGDKEVEIEVEYFDKTEQGSGAVGYVHKINLNDKVLFENQ